MLASAADLAKLLGRVAEGDRAAFAHVYRATSPKLFGVILRILKRRELAEEVLQEVYVRIWERAADFTPGRASPITWMATIARNRALDEARKRRPKFVEDDAAVQNIADTGPSPAQRLLLSEEMQKLLACLDRLPDERRDAVKLAYLDGVSRQELAERFGQPVGTIKTWLHRSLKQLKDCLGS